MNIYQCANSNKMFLIFLFHFYRELSFAKGDTIYLRREIDKNWFEGEHHGNVGIFPRAYVEVRVRLEMISTLLAAVMRQWDVSVAVSLFGLIYQCILAILLNRNRLSPAFTKKC